MRRAPGLAAAVVLLAAAAAAVRWLSVPVLLVEDVHDRLLASEPVQPGDVLVLTYVHSSEHVPVRGTFRVERDGTLTVTQTAFAGFGPGLPELGPSDAWRIEHGMIVHEPVAVALAVLRVRVAPITHHRLSLPSGRQLDLSALLGAGGSVRIRVVRRALHLLGWSSVD